MGFERLESSGSGTSSVGEELQDDFQSVIERLVLKPQEIQYSILSGSPAEESQRSTVLGMTNSQNTAFDPRSVGFVIPSFVVCELLTTTPKLAAINVTLDMYLILVLVPFRVLVRGEFAARISAYESSSGDRTFDPVGLPIM